MDPLATHSPAKSFRSSHLLVQDETVGKRGPIESPTRQVDGDRSQRIGVGDIGAPKASCHDPPIIVEARTLQCARQRIDQPKVGNAGTGVDRRLDDAIEARRSRRDNLTNLVERELQAWRV